MRDIKFRGLTAKGLMVYGDLINDREGSTNYWKEYSQRICWLPESGGCANAPVKNGTVGQFTGLLDKNGAEIYEGDIIKTTALFNDCNQKGAIDYFTVISFMGNYCLARHGSEAGSPMYPACLKSSIEVIGNIHENPELLKE